jgi:Big-like domain-containing protein
MMPNKTFKQILANIRTAVLPALAALVFAFYPAGVNASGPLVANTVIVTRRPDIPLKIRISDLLTHASDANGAAVTLSGVSQLSTNGVTVRINPVFVFYDLPPRNTDAIDSFNYVVTDSSGATATGMITVVLDADLSKPPGKVSLQIPPEITSIQLINCMPLLTCAGTPGTAYYIQAAASLTPPIQWTTVCTNVAGTNSQFQFLDAGCSNYPARFYRALWHPQTSGSNSQSGDNGQSGDDGQSGDHGRSGDGDGQSGDHGRSGDDDGQSGDHGQSGDDI